MTQMLIPAAAGENLREVVRAWVGAHGRACSLSEAEQWAEEARSICAQVVLEHSLGSLSGRATYRGSSLACPCGSEARFVSYRRRWIKTLCGESGVKRAYYHCRACGRGVAPWDKDQGLNSLVWTPRVKSLVAQASARLPYREAVDLLGEAGVVRLEESSAEAIVSEVGARLREEEAQKQASVLASAESYLAGQLLISEEERSFADVGEVRQVCGERLYVSLDAAKAHVDGEWHDIKVGALYTVRRDPCGVDTLSERSYVAAQKSSEAFGWQLRVRALEWGQPRYQETVVVADGAEYNWSVAQAHFPEAVQVLDFWHATEHVWSLSRQLYRQEDPKEKARGDRWARERIASLKEQGPVPLLRAIKRRKGRSKEVQEALRRETGYFRRNRLRMQYPQFRERGMMIGSGPVEAACKVVVVQRMKQSGMRWSYRGADHLLAIRTALLSKDHDRIRKMAYAD